MLIEKSTPSKTITYRGSRWQKDHQRDPVHQRHAPKRFPTDETSSREAYDPTTACCPCLGPMDDYQGQLNRKFEAGVALLRQANLLDNAHVGASVPSPKPRNYRTHAKLAVRVNPADPTGDNRFLIGLFRPNTHDVQEHVFCQLHRETINAVVRDLRTELNKSSLQPYDEAALTGDLRYIAVRASHLSKEVMITFVVTHERVKSELLGMILRLRKMGHGISSAHLNINDQSGNAIFGLTSKRLAGSDRLRERLCDLDFEIGVTSFFQVNPWQAESIYCRVEHFAGTSMRGDVAWDLYCGIGQISMLLARSGFRTLGVEENAQATRDAQKNATRNLGENQPHFIAGRVEELHDQFPSWALPPKLVVVNPSRRGLHDSVRVFLRDLLTRNPDTRLIYVSCEVSTLARDLAEIVPSGKVVRQLEAFDMFPYTDKMEWLAVLN